MEGKIFDTHVQGLKYKAVRELIKSYDRDTLATAYYEIPKLALPGPNATLRCCVYKERAIFQERLNIINKGIDANTKAVVEVIDIACDECPADGILVTQACRGCLSHKCKEVCPRDAIEIVGKRAVINKDKCIECGKCVEACPYGAIIKQQRPCVAGCKVQAISLDKSTKKAVVSQDKCVSCGACVRQCPFGAVQERSLIMETLDLLKYSNDGENYKVYAIIAPSIASQVQSVTMGQLVSGILALGFDGVVEAAFGADVCLEHELAEWQQKKLLTTSCCPAFVSFIEKHFPDIVPYVSSSFSPMVETAKTIKKGDPTAKCIFIGPCAAKKMEVKNPKTEGYVDSAISFEELQAFFAARNVEVGDLAETEVNNATYFGRIFAKSGGITQGLVSLATEKGVEGLAPISMNGLAECKVNLLKLRAKLKSNKLVENFFEGMACEGGCINGPLTLHQSSKNATAVESHAKQATTQSVGEAVRQYEKGKMDFQK